MNLKKIWIILVGFGFIFMIAPSLCWTKDYPNKPIEFVNPYAPGGSVDLSGRIIGEKMGEFLGQPIVVVSKAGGAGQSVRTTWLIRGPMAIRFLELRLVS
jgi:tripartite-type tricarboxylate transporter receptor subunit TctC